MDLMWHGDLLEVSKEVKNDDCIKFIENEMN